MTRTEPGVLREELGNNLQIGLGTGLIGGGLLGFLAAAATLALNPVLLRSVGDVLRLVLGLQFVYAVLCLALGFLGASIKALLFFATGRRISDTKTAAFVSGIAFFILGALYGLAWCRWNRVGGLSPDGTPSLRNIPVYLAILAGSLLFAWVLGRAFFLLIVYVKKPERRRPGDLRRVFLVLLLMAGAFAVFVGIMRATAGPPPAPSGLTRDSIHPTGRRLLLLGIDGMSDEDVARLREAGLLGWTRTFDEARRAEVPLPPDPLPPMVWTVVATGRDLAAHAIVDYEAQIVKGISTPLRIGPNQVGLFEFFHTVLPFFHMTRKVPIKSYMRQSKGLWNMVSDAGLRCVAVNWWVSWPAERVRGSVVSDHAWLKLTGPATAPGATGRDVQLAARGAASVQMPGPGMIGASSPLRPDGEPLLLERETWPPTLLVELAHLAGHDLPDSLAARYGTLPSPAIEETFTRLGIPADVVRSDLFYAQSAAWLLDREHPDLWMLHLPGPDILRRVLQRRFVQASEREQARRAALAAYWQALDPALQACFRRSGDRDLDLWVCLPGHPWPDLSSPGEGFVALAGKGLVPGRLRTPMHPQEIAPTTLWLMGLPASREMDGAPRTELLSAGAAAPPVAWITGYGEQETEGLEQAATTLDQEMIERFKSLGYIR